MGGGEAEASVSVTKTEIATRSNSFEKMALQLPTGRSGEDT
jgi:hypothetical protein